MKNILPYLPVLERFFAMQGERWFANVQPRNQSWRKPESGDMWQFLKYSLFLFTHSFFSLFFKNGLQFFTSPTEFLPTTLAYSDQLPSQPLMELYLVSLSGLGQSVSFSLLCSLVVWCTPVTSAAGGWVLCWWRGRPSICKITPLPYTEFVSDSDPWRTEKGRSFGIRSSLKNYK